MAEFFERDFESAYENGGFRLVTVDTDGHMNFVVTHDRFGPNGVTLTPEQVKEVRDTLNELYPPEPEKYPYEVSERRYDGYYPIVQKQPTTYEKKIAVAKDEVNAKKIAQALNEAEGL
jgi:hypothetical protein